VTKKALWHGAVEEMLFQVMRTEADPLQIRIINISWPIPLLRMHQHKAIALCMQAKAGSASMAVMLRHLLCTNLCCAATIRFSQNADFRDDHAGFGPCGRQRQACPQHPPRSQADVYFDTDGTDGPGFRHPFADDHFRPSKH
jgi:hypothetical protein